MLPEGPRRSTVRRALLRFEAASVIALIVVGVGTFFIASTIAKGDTLRDAERLGSAVSGTIVGPLVTDEVMVGDPMAFRRLDASIKNRMRDGSIVRVKVWTRSGRVVYADQSALVGQVFPLEKEDGRLIGTTISEADVSDLTGSENILERNYGELVEVYTGFRSASGDDLLFEAYLPMDRMTHESDTLKEQMLPVSLAALVLMQLLVLPLAISLARRVDKSQAAQQRMLRQSVQSSELERRRIAQDLHDGIIQELAGLGYALTAGSGALRTGDLPRAARALGLAEDVVCRNVEALRTLATDIYPPRLADDGLARALNDLVGEAVEGGVLTTLRCPPDLRLAQGPATLAFRAVRESLRNARRHSGATRVHVEVEEYPEAVRVVVTDNGGGFDPGTTQAPRGHLGLQVLRDTMADAGGRMEIRSAPGEGTVVVAWIPLS